MGKMILAGHGKDRTQPVKTVVWSGLNWFSLVLYDKTNVAHAAVPTGPNGAGRFHGMRPNFCETFAYLRS